MGRAYEDSGRAGGGEEDVQGVKGSFLGSVVYLEAAWVVLAFWAIVFVVLVGWACEAVSGDGIPIS